MPHFHDFFHFLDQQHISETNKKWHLKNGDGWNTLVSVWGIPGLVSGSSPRLGKATEYTATSLVCGRIYKVIGQMSWFFT